MSTSTQNESIETRIKQLRELTSWFESEDFELEQAMAKFDEAQKLAEQIEKDLMELKNQVTLVKEKFDQ